MFLRLLWHLARRAASRADWIAGNNRATRMPMMAITTNSSTSVNALDQDRRPEHVLMQCLPVTIWRKRHPPCQPDSPSGLLSAPPANTQYDRPLSRAIL